MPIARFEMPDGRIARYEVPEGTTPEQAQQLISQQIGSMPSMDENAKTAPFSFKDLALSAGSGGAGGLKALTDLFGTTNAASTKLGEAQQAALAMKTPERQAEIARRETIKERAKGDTWEEIKAGLGGFAEAPLQETIEALTSSAPIIAGSLLAPEVALPAAAARVGLAGKAIQAAKSPATGIGALMGLGGQKGQDYETVKAEALNKGMKPEEAERLAQAASEYSLQNLPRQAASTLTGGLEGALGVENVLGKLGKTAPKAEVSKGMKAPSWSEAVLKNVGEEAAPEFIQAATGQLGSNQALNQAGLPTDMLSGVLSSAIHDAVVGGALGAATSPAKMSALRKSYVQDQLAKERETQAKIDAGIKAEEEKLAQTKETFAPSGMLGLPAPTKEIAPPIDEPVLVNPLGNITTDELGPEVTKYINQYRKDNGMPKLQSYSIEDVKDAMTAVNPKGEQGALDAILTSKTGYTGTEKYTPEDVFNAAVEKNVATDTVGFKDFLSRTTGSADITSMSPPQLFSAFKALKDMPANLTGAQIVLPEGTNASRFKPAQYKKAVDFVNMTFDEMGGVPLSVDTIIQDIQDATGLETKRDANALLNMAIKNDDLAESREVVFRTIKPDTGELIATYKDKAKADAAAKKQSLNVQEGTLVQVQPAVKPEVVKPRATLPQGYEIAETAFVEGEKPTGYNIAPEGRVKPLATVMKENEIPAKIERLQGLRRKEADQMVKDIAKHEATVQRGRNQLESMEARGEMETEGYKKAEARQKEAEAILNRRINSLKARVEEYSAPLQAKPVGTKEVTRKGFTVSKQGQKSGTFPTREAAEESILADLSDEALDALVSDKKFGGLQNRAAAEQNRRRSGAPKTGKKVSEVLEGMKPKTEPETQETIEKTKDLRAMLDKFGLKDVGVKIVKAIEEGADGSYAAKLIQIAIDAKEPIRTMRHEAIHALKELGFFTDAQWASLEKMAKSKWIHQYLGKNQTRLDDGSVVSRLEAYKRLGLSEADIVEEAIADAFGDFDASKAPPGMLTALLNKMRNFFEALGNYLSGRGFESYKDVFGKIEKGELKGKPAVKTDMQPQQWKATPEVIAEAEQYFEENGIKPYTSEGQMDVPVEVNGKKFSIKSAYTEAQATERVKKRRDGTEVIVPAKFNDPITGLPMNADGTVTLYYPTTNEIARNIATAKKLTAHSPTANRIYLTNESSANAVAMNPGMIDQPLGGANVMFKVDPSLIELAQVHDDTGRRDFFIPIAEGEVFAKKMKMTKLFTVNAPRDKGLHADRTLSQVTEGIEKAANAWKNANPKERAQMFSDAKDVLREQHNIGTLFGANAKLEKTNIGDYGLLFKGKKVMSTGLGFASAQKINDQSRESTCPKSAICEALCLGETSGQNELYGGEGPYRSGPRLSQFLKTEAFIVNPEAFTVSMIRQIENFRNSAKNLGYYPAIRLNVTSDFPAKMYKPVIEMFPDVQFYDYTKLETKPIAENHHLTYSSTGASQVVNGDIIYNKESNWDRVVDKILSNGKNVAMAFSSRNDMPKRVFDERTKQVFEVWNGDEYDARFLDPVRDDGKGWIVGLTNKDRTTAPDEAASRHNGFFMDYDPERDGDTLVIQDQKRLAQEFKGEEPSAPAFKGIPISKFSLRSAPDTKEFKQWFGDSKVVNADGTPKVMYHGTARDISTFKPKQANAIFLTENIETARKYAADSAAWMSAHPEEFLTKDELAQGVKDAIAAIRKDYKKMPEGKVMIDSLKAGTYADATAEAQEYLRNAYKMMMPSGSNIMPVYVSAQKPFDYQNRAHVQRVLEELTNPDDWADEIARGTWSVIESDEVQEAIQMANFDGFYVQEGGDKNLAVYEPTQVKSATGNIGTYDVNNPDIRYSLRAFDKSDLPKDKKSYTLPENTMLFHGAHEERANEIEKSGRVLLSRPSIKTSGGSPDEGGLIFFGDKNVATKYANSEADPMAVQFARERGETRNPGVVFETATDRPYKLMNKRYILSKKEADALNKALGLPDYKRLEKGDSASLAAGRGLTNSRVIDRYKTNKGEMASPWPVIFRTLGYDGYYDDFAVALTADNGIRLIGDDGRLVKFSLRNIGDEIRSMPNGQDIYDSIRRTTTKRDDKGFIERLMDAISPESVSSLRQKALNRYNQLSVYDQELAKKMGGAALLADASAESAALMSDLAAGVTAAALGVHNRRGGIPVFKNGMTTVDNSVKGPTEIFYPLAAMGDPEVYQAYQFWAGAKRGARFLADGKEQVYTPAMINYAKQLESKYPEFATIQKEWIDYNNGLVQYMVDTGVLSKEKANEFKRHGDYIPFYRQLDGEKTIGPNIFQSISGVKPPKALKGSEAPLADFLETIVRNTQAAIQAGMKNTAAQRAVDVAVQIGQAKELPAQSSSPDTVTVLRNGKAVSYETADRLFIEAVKSLNLPELPFLGILSGPANLLRNLVTKDPGFMLANLMRDSMSAYVTSGANMLPVVDTIKNFGRSVGGNDPAYQALLNAGALGGYEFSQNLQASGEALAKDLRAKTGTQTGFEKIGKPFTSLWAALEKGTEASDAATRMAVYKDTLARTGNEAEALFRALEVMNFNRKGSSAVVRVLTAAIPFLNARMQGLDVLYRAAFGRMGNQDAKAIQKSFFVRGATMFALSGMYWALTHDDDDYKKQEQETKDNNWLIPSLGIKIPIPFEVGILFKVIPERLAAYAFGNDTGRDLSESMGRALRSTFGVAPPQVVLPILEVKTNYSFYTGRPIVGQGMEGVAAPYQVGPGTSLVFQKLGKELNASPIMLEHLFKGYTGSMGMYLVDLLDAIGDANSNSPKAAKRFEQMPIIKRFALDPEARGTVTSYYELKKAVDETVRTYNLLERTSQGEDLAEYTKENAKLLMTRDFISSMDKDLKELQDMTIAVRNSPMTSEAKRDTLTALNKASNALTANIQNIRKAVE